MTNEEQLLKEGKEVVGQYRSYFLGTEEYSSVKSTTGKKPNLKRLEKAKEDLQKSLGIIAEFVNPDVDVKSLHSFIEGFKREVTTLETSVRVLKEDPSEFK